MSAAAPFDKLVEEIGKELNSIAPYKAVISRLNKARVGFKHHSVSVTHEDALAFCDAVKTFLTTVSNSALELDFWSVFLVQAVGHQRAKNMLEDAESAYLEGKYGASIIASAKALAVYNSGERHINRLFRTDIREDQIALRTALLDLGIKYEDYARYQMIAPSVSMTLNGSLSVVIAKNHWIHKLDTPDSRARLLDSHGPKWVDDAEEKAKEAADFCLRFVVDWVLRVQDRFPVKTTFSRKEESVIVEKECDLRVNLKDDEVIRRISVGEKLRKVVDWEEKENGDFVCVLQDGDKAFVRKDCVRFGS